MTLLPSFLWQRHTCSVLQINLYNAENEYHTISPHCVHFMTVKSLIRLARPRERRKQKRFQLWHRKMNTKCISLSLSFLPSLCLSLLFKLLEVLPNWVLNANQEVECSKIKANAGRMASPSGWLGFRESRAGPLAPSEALREISCLMNTLIRTITIYKMIIRNEGR